jgi:hypothetical protein
LIPWGNQFLIMFLFWNLQENSDSFHYCNI